MMTIAVLTILLPVTVSHTSVGNNMEVVSQSKAVEILQSCETLEALLGGGETERSDVLKQLKKLMKMPATDLRKSVISYLKGQPSDKIHDSWATASIVNRLYFNVPENETSNEYQTFPFFPAKEIKRTALWPLEIRAGEMVLAGEVGSASPVPYFFVQEFDLFKDRFGVRHMKNNEDR